MVSAAGTVGGRFGMAHLRQILTAFEVLVIPEQYGVVFAFREFDKNGDINSDHIAPTKAVGARLGEVVNKLNC